MEEQMRVMVIGKGKELIEVANEAAEISSWELITASNRRAAIQKINSESPSIIILGYLEPQGEAFKLHKLLKQNEDTSIIPLIIVDVDSAERNHKGWQKAHGMDMDAEDYLTQPVTAPELVRSVVSVLSENMIDTIK